MLIFYTNYHIAVNECMVNDLTAIGHKVIMPSVDMAKDRIWFFAPNDEHASNPNVEIVSYERFLSLPPMAIIIPCCQLYHDFMKLYEERGKKDILVYLAALNNTIKIYPLDGADFVISHDIVFHRACKAKYKILYFGRPPILIPKNKDYEKAFREKKIKLYINNFMKDFNKEERIEAEKFADYWGKVPFFGYGNPDGWLSREDVQKQMVDSFFTLSFKRMDTWGNAVLESMLLGTPAIFLKKFIRSTFTQYLINHDTAIIGETVEEIVDKLHKIDYYGYLNMCFEAQKQAEMFTNDQNRREKLRWLFDKVEKTFEKK